MTSGTAADASAQDALDRLANLLPEFSARAGGHDATDEFVDQNYAALKGAQLMSLAVPRELGGHGIQLPELSNALKRIAHSCASTALAFAMHTHIVASLAWNWRHHRAPVASLLRRIAKNQLVLATSNGSDWLDSSGTARRVQGGFVIDATKRFVSGAAASDLLVTSAIYEHPQGGPTVLHFIMPIGASNVTVESSWHAMGMRGTGSNVIQIKELFVSDGMIIARRPPGKWDVPYHVAVMIALPLIYSVYLGIAEAARNAALELTRRRDKTAQCLALAGEMDSNLHTARIAVEDMLTGASGTPGPSTTNRIFMDRTLATQSALAAVEKALELAGGAGFMRTHPIERMFRDIQAARFHPLSISAQRAFAGRMAFDVDIDGPIP
jgi:alkylation response protein AidB-like acyl-CoA dehydrogenase